MPNPEKKVMVKVVKDKNGARSTRTTETTSKEGTPDQIIKGTPSTIIKGKEGSPAVLANKGVRGNPEFDKAFGNAKKSGKQMFVHNGKTFKVQMSGTKGKPAVNPTPDIVTPGTPDRIIPGTPPAKETKVEDKPIPSAVYKIDAQKGTIGGAKRDGIGGGITTDSQVTANKDVAGRAVKAQSNYNSKIDVKYAPDTDNEDGLNPAQLAAKNAKAEKRRNELKGTTAVSSVDVQSGLERKKVEELKNKNTQGVVVK